MTKTLQLAPVVLVQIGTIISDGSPITIEGTPIQSQVPLTKLAGCEFYDEVMAKLPEFQAQLDATEEPSAPGPEQDSEPGQTEGVIKAVKGNN
jgi:hypothetical protein